VTLIVDKACSHREVRVILKTNATTPGHNRYARLLSTALWTQFYVAEAIAKLKIVVVDVTVTMLALDR